MKTLIAIVVCGVVGFGGMQLYLWSKRANKPESQTPPAVEQEIVTKPWTDPEPSRPVARRSPSSGSGTRTTPKKTPTSVSKPAVAKSTNPPAGKQATAKPKQPARVYFTAEEINPNGIPNKIVVHNMPEAGKNYTVHLVGVRDLNRGPFRRAIGSGKGSEWTWDVRVDNGVISVSHNGQSIPQGR